MRLLRVELRRLLSRWVVRLALVGALVVAGVAVYGVHRAAVEVDQSRIQAQAIYEDMLRTWEPPPPEAIQMCLDEQQAERERSGITDLDFGCEQMAREPRVEDFMGVMPTLVDQFRMLLTTLVYPLAFLALAIGSTHVAAEFAHRTLGSWMTFVPRRTPVLLSKIGSAGLLALPMGALSVALVLSGVLAVFRWHGIDEGLSAADWTSVLWMAARVVALVGAAGALGAAAAFILRHSGVVLGAMIGYLVLVEGALVGLFPSLQRYLLGLNINGFVEHGTTYQVWPRNCGPDVPVEPTTHVLSFAHSSTVLAVLLVVVLVLAWASFRRADLD